MPTIRVVVRFRPINSREKKTAEENNWSNKVICPIYVDDKHLLQFDDISEEDKIGKQVRCAQSNISKRMQPQFAFDEILVWVNQQTAYQRIGHPVVMDALNGINGTIFAYGQTGSGKTFSMFGPEPLTVNNPELMGIIPRCCATVFTTLNSDPSVKQYRINVSFFEIYIHNTIRDLLHPAKKGDQKLKVRDGNKGVFIEGLQHETATNLEEILSLIALANSHRTVSSTKMNATSSRSHSVMRLDIRIERKDGSRCKSELNFGDLAGSEKVNKTGATGQTLREAQAINQSLTMLGNVISALAKIGSGKKKKGSMVPFRDSALTHVLKDSLSGNCKTTLVTAASPHKYNIVETISTFRFGSRCKLVKTKAEKNIVLSSAQMRKMIETLKNDIKTLKLQLLQGGGQSNNNYIMSSGIGIKITWPNDFQEWTTDKKVYNVLKQQINKQIKQVLSKVIDSDEIENINMNINISELGTKRKVIVGFSSCNDDENGRENCILLSKKLENEINSMDKSILEPALRNYQLCKSFSDKSSNELKQIIETQNTQINTISGENDKYKLQLDEKQKEIINLQQTMGNFDHHRQINGSMSSMSSIGSIIQFPQHAQIFDKTGNIRTGNNSLSVADLLKKLCNSQYKVLTGQRSLQLLKVRFASEKKKMQQLRYIISRMQGEYMDLKTRTQVSNDVQNIIDDEDNNFNNIIENALDDIINDEKDNKSKNKPQLIRRISALDNNNNNKLSNNNHGRRNSRTGRSGRSGRQRRKSALDRYDYNHRNKNNLNKQIYSDNKQAQKYGKATANYLVKQSKSMRKQLVNSLIEFENKKLHNDNDVLNDDLEEKKENNYIPNVPFTDSKKLWTGYDREWIIKWSIDDVISWLKKIYAGRMRKYTKNFRKKKINGKKLLDLQMPDLLDLHLIRNEAMQILAFTNSIADSLDDDDDDYDKFFNDLDDFDQFFNDLDDDIDDFFDDDTDNNIETNTDNDTAIDNDNDDDNDKRFYDDPTMRLTNLMIEQLNTNEINQVRKLPLFQNKNNNNNECINFSRIKEYYANYSQVMLLRIYGLLCNKIGLLNIGEWNNLIVLSKSEQYKKYKWKDINDNNYFDDYMVIINSFVDVYTIYSQHSDNISGKLSIQGSKYFINCIRQTEMENINDLRDDEDAVEFFSGIRIDEMEKLVTRLPKTIWQLINNQLEIEFVYRKIKKISGTQNITPVKLEKCIIEELGAEFVSPNIIQKSIKEMNLLPNPTIILDIYIKKLFIKENTNTHTQHAAEIVLDELLRLNNIFESEYYKQQRLEMIARDSIGSQSDYDNLDTLKLDDNENGNIQMRHVSANSWNFGSSTDDDDDYNYHEEKEVSYIDNYLDLHKLLHDVGQFGTCGKCYGLQKLPSKNFSASSTLNNVKVKKCKLNGKYGWTGDYIKNKDTIHWIQVDLGKITTVFAVAIQGKADKNEYITKGVLTVSNTYNPKNPQNDEWKKVQLTGNSNGKLSCENNQTVKVYMFARYIKARYVRLNIYKYHEAPSVRWDLLFGDIKIDIDNIGFL